MASNWNNNDTELNDTFTPKPAKLDKHIHISDALLLMGAHELDPSPWKARRD